MKEGNWKTKTFRIRPEALELYKYLEYWGIKKGISSDVLFDEIVTFCLNYLRDHPLSFSMSQSKVNRVVKGFSLQQSTLNDLMAFHKEHNDLYIGETVEAFLGLYAHFNLSPDEQKSNDLISWFNFC